MVTAHRPSLRKRFDSARELARMALLRRRESRGDGMRAENVIWIFGSPRTGSTWLSCMMGEISSLTVWREPLVGALFGNFYYRRAEHRIDKPGKHFIMGKRYKNTWLRPMRELVLGGAAARFAAVASGGYLVIKEPNGSIGAPLLMEALPESRMILLVRDPRDVVASTMDARRADGWHRESRGDRGELGAQRELSPDAFVRTRARSFLEHMGNAKRAYDAHKGLKVLVRYEELRADTLATMRRLYDTLEIPVETAELAHAVRKHSWENIPAEQKGERKFYRKATPGSWRQDLTPEQARIVERVTAPLLEELYPEDVGRLK